MNTQNQSTLNWQGASVLSSERPTGVVPSVPSPEFPASQSLVWEGTIKAEVRELQNFCNRYNLGVGDRHKRCIGWKIGNTEVEFVNAKYEVIVIIRKA